MEQRVGYQEPDVEYHEENDETVRRLRDNDPDIGGLDIPLVRCHTVSFEHSESLVIEQDKTRDRTLGCAIRSSKHLRKLKITGRVAGPSNWESTNKFLERVAENRSIEHLYLDRFTRANNENDAFKILVPFFEHNRNIRSIEIHNTDLERVPEFFSVIFRSEMIRIERISLYFCTTSKNDGVVEDLIRALNCMPGLSYLTELSLEGTQIGNEDRVSVALSDLLKNNATRLQILRLRENDIDNSCMVDLTSGLLENSTIKVLKLAGQLYTNPWGWKFFSAYLSDPRCSVETLDLSGNYIDNEVSIALGNAMANSKKLKLKSLNLDESQCAITSTGWRGLSLGLRSLAIEELHLSDVSIDDDGAIAIASALNSTCLKSLDMGYSYRITSRGWIQCFRLLIGSKSILKSLELDDNGIDDEGADLLVRLLANNQSLSTLTLRGNRSITMDRWSAFAGLLHPSSSSKLKVLKLGATNRGSYIDQYVAAYAGALANNTSLEVLGLLGRGEDFDFAFADEISMQGWTAFAKALCDNSSITSICSSNHSLYEILNSGDERYCRESMPSRVQSLLDMNREKNKAEVVRSKILRFFFIDADTVERTFADVGTAMMPDAIGCLGRDRLGFSTLYLLLRSMPWLFISVVPNASCSVEPPTKLQKLE